MLSHITPKINPSDYTGEVLFVHDKKINKRNSYLSREKIEIRCVIPREIGVTSVKTIIYDETKQKIIVNKAAEWIKSYKSNDIYSISVKTKELGIGLFFFDFIIETFCGTIYSSYKNNGIINFSNIKTDKKFQLSISKFKYKKPRDFYGGIIYEIFVDRFERGEKIYRRKDGIYPNDWTIIPEYPEYPGAKLKNNSFYGGNLYGIINKLSYLKDLGITTLYLTPIFESVSNHKYDTADYMKVDIGFGGDKALACLISESKKFDIKIILDGVFNHTGADSIYFDKFKKHNEIGAYQSKKSSYYSWYDFKKHPDDYVCWWNIDILPRVKSDNQSFQSFIAGEKGVIEKYIKMGISGFRLDVVDELNDDFIRKIKKAANKIDDNSVLYGEVWEDASNKISYNTRKKYYLGDELDSVMNYPLRKGLINYFNNDNFHDLFYALTDVYNNAPKRISDLQMNLLGSHDTVRIINELSGISYREMNNSQLAEFKLDSTIYLNSKNKLKELYTVIATLPGIPMIYYGDEIGMQGFSDPFNRMPYQNCVIDSDLLNHYKKIGNIRKSNTIYKSGEFKLLYLTEELLVFERYNQYTSFITIYNNLEKNLYLHFEAEVTDLLNRNKGNKIELPAKKALIVKTKKHNKFKITEFGS